MRLIKEPVKVLIGAVARRHFFIIAYVVPCILKGRIIAGVDPERIAAKAFYVLQFLCDSVDITDSVPVRIIEGLWIDFIKN